ncbi:MAG TPA: hypothetical protein VK914_06200 [bacterium]|jgi:hypothetical protein|nr:hypothetical protein [bacterium]
MLNSLKTSVSVLLGLVLGCLIVVPTAWYGVRIGADSLRQNVWNRLSAVQDRQQAMADQALKLQPMLQRYGVFDGKDVFKDVENERSLLAGDASLEGKLEHAQRLEEALLRSERVWVQSGKKKARLASEQPWNDYGRVWERQKRLLVVEESELVDAVDELDGITARWPVSVLLAHKTFAGMTGGILGSASGDAVFLARVGLDWLGYELRRMAALVGQQTPPPPPVWGWKPAVVPSDGGYVESLPTPIFLADAPLPEGDYQEIQYSQTVPANYANVELNQDKAVLENSGAPAAFKAPTPKPQTTVVYSAPN